MESGRGWSRGRFDGSNWGGFGCVRGAGLASTRLHLQCRPTQMGCASARNGGSTRRCRSGPMAEERIGTLANAAATTRYFMISGLAVVGLACGLAGSSNRGVKGLFPSGGPGSPTQRRRSGACWWSVAGLADWSSGAGSTGTPNMPASAAARWSPIRSPICSPIPASEHCHSVPGTHCVSLCQRRVHKRWCRRGTTDAAPSPVTATVSSTAAVEWPERWCHPPRLTVSARRLRQPPQRR